MLYRKEILSSTTLFAIWKMEESKEELLNSLSRHDWLADTLQMKSEERIKERLAVRVLLKELLGQESEISYFPSGKPYLEEHSFNIGISHTKGYVALILSREKKVSIDIENKSDRILKLERRIVSEKEFIDTDNNLIHLLLHWSAKESVFKVMDEEGVDFLDHLRVDNFTPEVKGFFVLKELKSRLKCQYLVSYEIFSDFVLTYIVDN